MMNDEWVNSQSQEGAGNYTFIFLYNILILDNNFSSLVYVVVVENNINLVHK